MTLRPGKILGSALLGIAAAGAESSAGWGQRPGRGQANPPAGFVGQVARVAPRVPGIPGIPGMQIKGMPRIPGMPGLPGVTSLPGLIGKLR